MSGGGGGGGHTQYDWNDTMAPYWTGALAQGQDLSQTPYQAYTGQRIAGMDPDQISAMADVKNFVNSSGSPVTQAANGQLQQTLSGNFLKGPNANPYISGNPYMDQNSPAFQAALKAGTDDITNAYQQGTAADTTRMFNLSGAFGGSANANAVAMNQTALAKQLANYTAGMQNDQYNRSAGLYEDQLNRGNQSFEAERGREMAAVPYGQNEQNLALQRYQALMGVGDMQRSLSQDQLNLLYNNFQEAKQYPYTQEDFLTGLLSRAQGGISPNVTTTTSGYSASPFSTLLGAGLVGTSLFGSH